MIRELQEYGCTVDVSDPWADAKEVKKEYGLGLIDNGKWKMENYDAIVLAVAHEEFKKLNSQLSTLN